MHIDEFKPLLDRLAARTCPRWDRVPVKTEGPVGRRVRIFDGIELRRAHPRLLEYAEHGRGGDGHRTESSSRLHFRRGSLLVIVREGREHRHIVVVVVRVCILQVRLARSGRMKSKVDAHRPRSGRNGLFGFLQHWSERDRLRVGDDGIGRGGRRT